MSPTGLVAAGAVPRSLRRDGPSFSITGIVLWWRRRQSIQHIKGNVAAQSADTVILVGSEGGATWGFAATLHAALSKAGQNVHVAPMNSMAATYAKVERLLFLASTYGDGSAPASANRFLVQLARSQVSVPFAVLGFGDRAFPKFCRFAEEIEAAVRARGWLALLPLNRIDRQSVQDFARWGGDLGAAIGTPLVLDHKVARAKTIRLSLIERTDYGREVQAPTTVFRFVVQPQSEKAGFVRRLFQRSSKLPSFTAGDLVGILPPGTNLPRFYSLASSTEDGVLEICVRKQPGGLCSGFLHGLTAGGTIWTPSSSPTPAFVRCAEALR